MLRCGLAHVGGSSSGVRGRRADRHRTQRPGSNATSYAAASRARARAPSWKAASRAAFGHVRLPRGEHEVSRHRGRMGKGGVGWPTWPTA